VRLGAVAAAVTALALFTVFIHCQVAVMGYRVLALQEQVENLENENRKLELSIAALSSLDRVQEVASSKLGMCMPSEAQVVALAADVADPPAPAAVHQGQQDVHTGVLQQAYERLSKTLARSKVVGMNE
jgi:cell division protein FtsL